MNIVYMVTLLEIYYIACLLYETIKNINISFNKDFIKYVGIHRHCNALYSWADVRFKPIGTVVAELMENQYV